MDFKNSWLWQAQGVSGFRALASLVCLLVLIVLAACESSPQPPLQPEVADTRVAEQPEAEELLVIMDERERQRRRIADILYEGLRALREDRLMTPTGNNAYSHFANVLSMEPDNTIARQGLQDIVQRYLELAAKASRQGQFSNAEGFLRYASRVDNHHPGLDSAYANLEQERRRTHSVHLLNARDLRNREGNLAERLHELAEVVEQNNTFVLITAPSDEQGRWIYARIQEALPERRVRGDIEIGGQPSVRLVLP